MSMKKHNAVSELRLIEKKYPVEDIKYNGIEVWPIFRVYIGAQLAFDRDRLIKPNKNNILSGLKYFFRGFKNLFKKYEYVVFSSSDQRKKIEGKYVDRSDFLDTSFGDKITIETPMPEHFEKRLYPDKMSSHMFLYGIEFILTKLQWLKKSKLENFDVLEEILGELDVNLDYYFLIKRFRAQYRTVKFLNRSWKVKFVLTTVPYTRYGYLYYFKENKIPVVELQHGVINKEHFAYNLEKNINNKFYPDYLLTFGDHEKKVFDNSFYIEKSNCWAVGSFYIDYLQNRTDENIVKSRYQGYSKYIAITLQDMYDKKLLDLLGDVFRKCQNYLFLIIPRNKSEAYYREKFLISKNTVFIGDLNTYEKIKMCDIHTTINSTTAIEAPSLGTPNILFNYNNLSVEYYSDRLSINKFNAIANSPQEYERLINEFEILDPSEVKVSNNSIFKSGYSNNLNTVISKIHVYFKK